MKLDAGKIKTELQEYFGEEKLIIKTVRDTNKPRMSIREECDKAGNHKVTIWLNTTKIRSDSNLQECLTIAIN